MQKGLTITAYTKVLDVASLRRELAWILDFLVAAGISEVELLFGVAWGNEYRDWTPFLIPAAAVLPEVAHAEALGVGQIGGDDLFLEISSHQISITCCHECDLHLEYANESEVVQAILAHWRQSGIYHVSTPAKDKS